MSSPKPSSVSPTDGPNGRVQSYTRGGYSRAHTIGTHGGRTTPIRSPTAPHARRTQSLAISGANDISSQGQSSSSSDQRTVSPQHCASTKPSSEHDPMTASAEYILSPAQEEHYHSIQQQQIMIAKRLFWGGCALLPWLWIVNLLYFRRKLMDSRTIPELKQWLQRSLAGASIATLLFVIWVILYQTQYDKWGSAGYDMMVYQSSEYWFNSNGPWENGT